MQTKKSNLIVIVGPTSSGKSELAVALAKKFNGEIISADSRQVYRGLDIGTGKVKGAWRHAPFIPVKTGIHPVIPAGSRPSNISDSTRSLKIHNIFMYRGIAHYCIDFVSPRRTYTVAEYKKCAVETIEDIARRGKLPILVGGTGFWIDAVVYDLALPPVPPDKKLRKRLERKTARELLRVLQRLDPERAREIEQKNPRRLIRAIEIAQTLGNVPPATKKNSPYRTLWIGISSPPDALAQRIHARLLRRIHQGMIKEAQKLHQRGLPWRRFYELGLEYRYLAELLRGRITKKEFLAQLEHTIQKYARRQMIWWKRNKKIKWIENPQQAKRLVNSHTYCGPYNS